MTQYESDNPRFPLSVELNKIRWKPLPKKYPKVKEGWRAAGCVMIGLIGTFVVCLVENSGAPFVPAFCVIGLLVWLAGFKKGGEE